MKATALRLQLARLLGESAPHGRDRMLAFACVPCPQILCLIDLHVLLFLIVAELAPLLFTEIVLRSVLMPPVTKSDLVVRYVAENMCGNSARRRVLFPHRPV